MWHTVLGQSCYDFNPPDLIINCFRNIIWYAFWRIRYLVMPLSKSPNFLHVCSYYFCYVSRCKRKNYRTRLRQCVDPGWPLQPAMDRVTDETLWPQVDPWPRFVSCRVYVTQLPWRHAGDRCVFLIIIYNSRACLNNMLLYVLVKIIVFDYFNMTYTRLFVTRREWVMSLGTI